jgi:hypothetical protein
VSLLSQTKAHPSFVEKRRVPARRLGLQRNVRHRLIRGRARDATEQHRPRFLLATSLSRLPRPALSEPPGF